MQRKVHTLLHVLSYITVVLRQLVHLLHTAPMYITLQHDVDKRPCSINKSDVSTSLTRRRRPRQSTLFSSNTVTDTAAIFSRLKGRHRQGARGALLILKQNSVSNRHRHSSMHVDDVAVATARACTICACVHTKSFLWRREKSLRSSLQNAVGKTKTFNSWK